MTRRFIIAAALVVAGVSTFGLVPSLAGARTLDGAGPGLGGDGPPVLPFRDRVLTGPQAAAATAPKARATVRTYMTQDGTPLQVELSTAYPDSAANRAEIQANFVDLLGARIHGSELASLHMFIAPPAEVTARCGGSDTVLACYTPQTQTMVVPGEPPAGFTESVVGYAITHEYGHHIAAHRLNTPFPTVDWGAKRWASQVKVCDGTRLGRYAPGDEGTRYLDNPGEGFADSYAHLAYPTVPFQYNRGFAPTTASQAALRRDVLTPWTAPRVRVVRGTAVAGRTFLTTIPLRLDGELRAQLTGPAGANLDVQMSNRRGQVVRTRTAGSRDLLVATVCRRGTASLESRYVRVLPVSGGGPFTLRITWPG